MAVNANDFSAAFFHISSLKNANTSNNTAASKQPNLFWFWEKYHDFFHIIRTCSCIRPKSSQISHNIIIIMISCLVKTVFLQIHAKSFCILALEGPRE